MDQYKNIKGILFDFDGTIFELKTDYSRMRKRLKKYFESFGIKKEFNPIIEKINESLEEIHDKTKVDAIRKAAYEIIEDEELKAEQKAILREGASGILNYTSKKYRCCIVSRNGRKIIIRLLNKYKLPAPAVIVAREDTEKLKPAKEHLEKALSMLNMEPHQCILVGDSIHDVKAGKRLNITTVLVDNGFDYLMRII
jgi:HAD superfamily hydrolase (TIGR01509 family)